MKNTEREISSLTNQNRKEINIARKNKYQEGEIVLKKQTDHLLPLFKGKSAKQILDTIQHSHIKPYSDEERKDTETKIREILKRNNLSK